MTYTPGNCSIRSLGSIPIGSIRCIKRSAQLACAYTAAQAAEKGSLDWAGSLTVIKSKNIGKPLKYGFFFVKFLLLRVVCVVIVI